MWSSSFSYASASSKIEQQKCAAIAELSSRNVLAPVQQRAVLGKIQQQARCAEAIFDVKSKGNSRSPLREKRPKREGSVSSKALALDLNLSAEENECLDDLSCTTDSNTTDRSADQETEEVLAKKVISLARESLPKNIFELADARVIFRPFDFATLMDGVLEQLGTTLRSVSVVKLMTDPGQALEVMQDATVVRVGLLPASIKCL
ncbi:hypothetical protein R1sor_008269 [Riccia sorocarpa]|uniref:Uncharacterized protein n=1 Tax=Riccia sorocarpa TaxID=122646 RepID=A0ABD3HT37_9MARC